MEWNKKSRAKMIIALSAGPGYTAVTPPIGDARIVDDDGAVVTITSSDAVASEAGDTAAFTVTRQGGDLAAPLLVQVNRSGTATNGADYLGLGGANFFDVEKGAACEEIANRVLTLNYGANGTQTVNDAVLNWRNVEPCGN